MRLVLALFLPLALMGCRKTEEEEPPADGDGDGFSALEDCDDADPAVFPGAMERCDGVDQDCDGAVDEEAEDAGTWFLDADGDGYGNPGVTRSECTAPDGYVVAAGDCDDGDADFHPGAAESDCTDPADYNCDGSVGYVDGDGDGFPACQDCDDALAAVSPAALEACDGVDNDCDGAVDEAGASGELTWYSDDDQDSYGDPLDARRACEAPAGYVADNRDCNDSSDAAHPGGVEVCDRLDNDCSGDVDDNAVDAATWYADGDRDAFGNRAVAVRLCEAPVGFVGDATDCDDADAATWPGAPERCDGRDNDCDTQVDEDVTEAFFKDSDRDGFGDAAESLQACEAPAGFVSDATDCDDLHAAVHPGAGEVCDALDNDCDAQVDEGVTAPFFRDADRDGFGDAADSLRACEAPVGYVSDATDCDDLHAASHPGAAEICDALDNDCVGGPDDGLDKDWFVDTDGDGFGHSAFRVVACEGPAGFVQDGTDCDDRQALVNPGMTEVCNGIDDDCDLAVDDDDPSLDVTTATHRYNDRDGDGYGDPLDAELTCAGTPGYVLDDTDCNDDPAFSLDALTAADVHPSASETWYDGLDQDCLGGSDYDQDGDGYDAADYGGLDQLDTDASCWDDCRDGSSQAQASPSCGDLLDTYGQTSDGSYWIDLTDDGDPSDAILAWCDMTGGGWTWAAEGEPFALNYTGVVQQITAPDRPTSYLFTLYGGSGGNGYYSTHGGVGGVAWGEVDAAPGETLYVYVGGKGTDAGYQDADTANTRYGGWNGGGRGTRGGSGGGGATDVRLALGDLSSRVLVAGGGGGCGFNSCVYAGGAGGGAAGDAGAGTAGYLGGGGGTQSAGGVSPAQPTYCNGAFGQGANNYQDNDEGGGGGGWYGGAACGHDNCAAGGGSSYFGGVDRAGGTATGAAPRGQGRAEYVFR
ncbi:MAG: hypothetical protein JXX28_04705 [Deltaproteobacteria bacterium]|nr:hypothetical protein [Deltaproteobacteria bacterium]